MPTRKEVSKIKSEFISEREKLIRSKITSEQLKLYDELVSKYLSNPIDKKDSRLIINQIEKAIKSFAQKTNSDILKQYTSAAYSITDLNMSYFSTLFEDKEKLNTIKEKTRTILNKRLGLNEDGAIKSKGFIDKMIADKTIQKTIVNEFTKAIQIGSDQLTLKNNIKRIIVGNENETGVFERHYNTFAKDILNAIDNSNSRIFAVELGLDHAYYAGGLITTSRSICLKNNGKIFTTKQIEDLRNDPFIVNMYGENIKDYNPFETPGGYGCLHSWDWITSDLAEGITRKQNKKATQRNNNFKKRNNI